MNTYIKIEIQTTNSAQLEMLVAELSEINFDAFEENENCLSAFIKEKNFNEDELKKFALQKKISYTKLIIPETNWNAKWESGFEPIIIDNFVAIRAAFHKPIPGVLHEIIITPKMSFGTGHHATTYLMLQQMQHIDFNNKTVLDFGTGTGVLAIMAKKSGAHKVTAIDNDEWSINNAGENFVANNCSDITLLQKDDLIGLGPFDIILANINLNVINASISQLKLISRPSAKLLLSGFLTDDEQILSNNFSDDGFKYIASMEKDKWLCMLITKYN